MCSMDVKAGNLFEFGSTLAINLRVSVNIASG